MSDKIPQILQFAEDSKPLEDIAKVQGVAYSGGEISQPWSTAKVVVDLEGMTIAEQIPIMYNHQYEPGYRLGEAIIEKQNNELHFWGEIDTSTGMGKALAEAGKKWTWQVSIGAENEEWELAQQDGGIIVNGKAFETPLYIVRKSKLREISLVAIGADDKTCMEIVAGFMRNSDKSNETKATIAETKQEEPETKETITMDETKKNETNDINAKLDEMSKTIANLNAKLETMEKQEEVRASRPAPQVVINHDDETPQAEIMGAAIEQAMGIEAKDTRANDIAAKRYHGHYGIKQLYTDAAIAAGWTGNYINNGNMAEAVSHIRAGFSNINLPGILGNATNKKIREGFDYAEQSWRQIAQVVSTSDYKSFATYILNSNGDYEEVPNGGTIPSGELAESSYTNQLKRYGLMFSIDEMDIINDDLGAINTRAFAFGRKASMKLNKVFWTLFQNDSDFFKAANGNIKTSAGALTAANLNAVVKQFRKMTDSNGDILGYEPAILLVPTAQEVTALGIYHDAEIRDTTANKVTTTGNPWRSKFKPVASAYLTNDDDYYLLADPTLAATIQVAFLDGQQAPVIETADAEFNTFGIRYRGKFSFGVAFADAKAGVKADKE